MNDVIHGDCLDVMGEIPAGSIDMILCDPPYGIDYQSAWRTDKTLWKPKVANDKEPFTAWIPEAYRVLKTGGCLACFTRYDVEEVFRSEMRKAGFKDKAQVIWNKVIHGMGDLRGDFAPCHENVIFAVKGRFILPGKRPKSIVSVQRVTADKLAHPNEKPVELMSYFVEHLSKENETVLDCFAGVGATGIACKNLKRNFILIEKDAGYCEIIKTRLLG